MDDSSERPFTAQKLIGKLQTPSEDDDKLFRKPERHNRSIEDENRGSYRTDKDKKKSKKHRESKTNKDEKKKNVSYYPEVLCLLSKYWFVLQFLV